MASPYHKKLYSLILFSGLDPGGWQGTDTELLTPFIDTAYFSSGYGDVTAAERVIDAQYVSATKYVTTTMINDVMAFGVSVADRRVKRYGLTLHGTDKTFYVKYVRGNALYGTSDVHDNGDGTITDRASGLMWQQEDGKTSLNREEALSRVRQKNAEHYLGYSDWRLP